MMCMKLKNLTSSSKKIGVLAIGAHPDDIELGCGATLSLLSDNNIYIISVIMTSGSCGGCGIQRSEESQEALKILGCHKVINLNFDDTKLYLQIKEMIFSLEKILATEIPPDIEIVRVYTMHNADRHQDHVSVYQASMVACRNIPQILGYETPSTWISFSPQVFESLENYYLEKKILSLSKHKSQSLRKYMQPEHLWNQAKFRGQQVNCSLCEGFVVHKMIL
ncbi:PIG-L deacetylase family protein [Escherichia coli]|uniref:PIG-L deacetylase family protein n=2 Tax=Escherichia coli TaxID=562 RepID=UPI0007A5C7B1|nr:PIG-L family deacetylase [Escherichia coli]ELO0562158.1 PIG-L family deacetylase [Escherichia coli O8]EEC8160411.1 PIG-L family deacetylase [Escherichia coli]EEQ1636489.1 PIG-L family deacetylase [Escherichia coli]EEQ1702958.1 PIG-L family deacetylase [Escherichia coli]